MANINGGGGGRGGLWRLGSSQNRLMSEYFNRCLPADVVVQGMVDESSSENYCRHL